MVGFARLAAKRARWLALHTRVRRQLNAALVERHRGAARAMIARQVQAALRPGGPDAGRFRARFLRQEADGLDLERRATIRAAFLLRQLGRMERKLDARD